MVYVVGDEDESPAALKQRQQEQARRATEGKGKARESDAAEDTYPLYIIVSEIFELFASFAKCPEIQQYHGSYEHYSSARHIKGPHTGKPEILLPESKDSKTPSSSSFKTQSGTLIATDEEKLVLSSLPDPSAHSLAEIRELIGSSGSWEAALEQLQEQDLPPKEPDLPSAASSPLSSTPSSPLHKPRDIPASPGLKTKEVRPGTPKRSLSESLNAASLGSTPPTKRHSSRLATIAASEELRQPSESEPSTPPAQSDESELSEFEDEEEEDPLTKPEKKVEARYSLRSSKPRSPVVSGREKRAARQQEKHQKR